MMTTSVTPEQEKGAAATLTYAPARGRVRWRRWIGVSLALALSVAAWRWGRRAEQQVEMLYWQQRCIRAAPPRDQVIFDTDPARVPALQVDQNYTALASDGRILVSRCLPEAWQTYGKITGLGAAAQNGRTTLVYLGLRQNARGETRLVVVEYDPLSWVPLRILVVAPGTWTTLPARTRQTLSATFIANSDRIHVFRLFAGQSDPADPTAFSIPFELDGTSKVLSGNITAGDVAELDIRDAKPSAMPKP